MKNDNPNNNAPYSFIISRDVLVIWGTSDKYKTIKKDIYRVIKEIKTYLQDKFPQRIIVRDFSGFFCECFINELNEIHFDLADLKTYMPGEALNILLGVEETK